MYKAVFKVLYMSKLWGLGVQHSKENIFALQSLSLNDGIKEKEITFKDDAMSFKTMILFPMRMRSLFNATQISLKMVSCKFFFQVPRSTRVFSNIDHHLVQDGSSSFQNTV